MNSHHQPLQQAPPAVPIHDGREGRAGRNRGPPHMPYAPSPPFHHGPPYSGYAYQYPMQYPRSQQQWSAYPMPMQMGRGYQPYPQLTPYPMHHNYPPPLRPPLQQAPSSSSVQSPRPTHSPSPSNHSSSVPPPASVHSPSPKPAPPTPPLPVRAAASPRSPSPRRKSFYPPLPWQSFEGEFPSRRLRRKRKPAPQSSNAPVELPNKEGQVVEDTSGAESASNVDESAPGHPHSDVSLQSRPPSEPLSTQPTTPSSSAPPQQTTPKPEASARPNSAVLPIIPAIPNLPTVARAPKQSSHSAAVESTRSTSTSNGDHLNKAVESTSLTQGSESSHSAQPRESDVLATNKPAPKSWADLVRTQAHPSSGDSPHVDNANIPHDSGFGISKATSMSEILSLYSVKGSKDSSKVLFLKPRGLVNTGNMCYMNSILQVLVFCVPFYAFLDSIGRKAAHSFKSDTPMLDAMIMFVREFAVIDAAVSVEQLRLRLKDSELEQYGDAFIPDFVYDVIRRLPRFSSMRRGHQQDAEEFLGFLLEELHDECSKTMRQNANKGSSGTLTPTNEIASPPSESNESVLGDDSGWLEVGPKQRAAITRSSGHITTESPITKIFGGKLRSELRVPGMKSSVTLEPYQPLQLDIGAPHVSNIVDALKGLTKSETLHGDFNSPRGPGSTATKQVTIETLPQVLILHLKRFQYDNTGGTQKIWKKVGYPLELEIPKEVFPQSKRGGLVAHGGLPKYRLISVVYHHGKNASGGHYTVDVRRQEGREWIRLDDTVIRRIRSEDVAEGGSEEDPKALAAALEKHKSEQNSAGNAGKNAYEQIAGDEEDEQSNSGKPWSQVNGATASSSSAVNSKKWSNVHANGVATPNARTSGEMTPVGRTSVKDNKVAYILFYEKVDG